MTGPTTTHPDAHSSSAAQGGDTDTRQLILDAADKLFTDCCDKAVLDRAEQGDFAQALWEQIVAHGFHQLGSADSGTDSADMFAFLQLCGRHALPLPIAETLLVNQWCGATDDVSAIGRLEEGRIGDIVWGRAASRIVGIADSSNEVRLIPASAVSPQGKNMAGEPLDQLTLAGAQGSTVLVADSPYAQMALARLNQMSGCLQTVLDMGIQYATERSQFGRSIGKFQAIQHSLAVVAGEVAAAKRAADAAVDALGDTRFVVEVAASKSRVGEAAGIVAEQVHQIHGAMGFTHEHRLHHFTRRAWAWRDSWGNEFYWQQVLGRHLAALGADQVWDFIATRA